MPASSAVFVFPRSTSTSSRSRAAMWNERGGVSRARGSTRVPTVPREPYRSAMCTTKPFPRAPGHPSIARVPPRRERARAPALAGALARLPCRRSVPRKPGPTPPPSKLYPARFSQFFSTYTSRHFTVLRLFDKPPTTFLPP